MNLVVDANILFSLANELSAASFLVESFSLNLIAPKFALDELKKYEKVLLRKSNTDNFLTVLHRLSSLVTFVEVEDEEVKNLSFKISDKKDIIYLVLASKYNFPIWSNDKHLKEQNVINVFTTAELVELFS
jgi:predicted nucleic acid-binding protein